MSTTLEAAAHPGVASASKSGPQQHRENEAGKKLAQKDAVIIND